MSIDLVRGELERLFSLDEMMALSNDLLGFAPAEIGGTASKASFARSLAERCLQDDAIGALLDAIVTSRSESDPRLRELGDKGIATAEELKPGDEFGPFKLTKKIGEGPRGVVYAATQDDKERTLKIFHRSAMRDGRALHRFLLRVRLTAKVENPHLPSELNAGIINGRAFVAYAPIDGQPLATRVTRTGPLHINEARPLVRGALEALAALHDAGLAHGALKLENILVARGADGALHAVLVDMGGDRLLRASLLEASPSALRATAPELFHAPDAGVASDLYSFGASLFEILTGKPAFTAESALDMIIAQLQTEPSAPSSVAPRGWVGKELDELCAKLLDKRKDGRPKDARAVLELLEPAQKSDKGDKPSFSEEELNDHVDVLLADPTDAQAALALEGLIKEGADPSKVAEAFTIAADQIEPEDDGEVSKIKAGEQKKQMLFRAARIYETLAKEPERAESVYAMILEVDSEDDVAFTALEELRKHLGKHEELVEMLLARSENSESHSERARALNEIGHLYVRELDDKEQGVFAFAKALGQDVQNDDYATDLERAAGSDMKLWAEALEELSAVSTHPRMPPEAKIALFIRLGRWYTDKIARPDLGLPCFQTVLSVDPAHDGALDGLAQVYRRAQQWQELGQILIARADRAPTPAASRDLRAEAAELLETKLNEAAHARDLYEQIFAEDPGHPKATEALARIYQKLEDHAGYAKILERGIEALRGEKKVEAICKLAELYEDQLNDLPEATRRYEAALEVDPQSLDALRGLDRIFNRTGRYKELLANLERQIIISATPRQKIKLYERIAGIHDEEFLDHQKAAEAYEAILQIDSAHEGALTALVRHYRALDRWEDVVSLYEKQLRIVGEEDKRRVELLLAMGRVLVEQIGSPDRASKAYEKVLEIDPHHAGALESLANVRAAAGDALAALRAIESLAEKATSAESRADLWIRAAKMLEDKGDRDGAIERYKKALDAQPNNQGASTALRAAYLARGDAAGAVELIARDAELAEGNLAKARLYGEMAQILREKMKDNDRAKEAATKALGLDPTSIRGLLVSGDIAFDAGRFLEASKHYESLANRVDALPKDHGLGLLIRYVDALGRTGATDKALESSKSLLELGKDDPTALARAAKAHLDAGKAKEAADLYEKVVTRFVDDLPTEEKAEIMLRFGEAKLKAGDPDGAISPLDEAADLAPDSPEPILLLCKVYEEKKNYEEVVRLKTRRIDVVSGEERSALLLEIGDIIAGQLNDRTRAAKSYVAALDERPDDRKILTKLMQLYSEEKDWGKLIEIVLKLAEKVEDKRQKAKYMHTAAIVSARQLGDLDQAVNFYDQVLALDPSLDKALAEAIEIRSEKGDHEGVEKLLKLELEKATDSNDTARMLELFAELGVLYKDKLGWMSEAIDAYEAAQTLDPENEERAELLAQMYASDPAQYFDKAVVAQQRIIHRHPYKPDAYKALRKLYTEAKRADAAWCLCQALFCLNLAEPDEERFFRRMRAEGVAEAQDRVNEDDWAKHLLHSDADPLLTAIFAVIQPAVLKKNGQPLEQLGYHIAYAIDLARHPYPISQTLYYSANVLGMDPPLTFQNPNDPSGLTFLHAHVPAIVLGGAALAAELPAQAAAFIAARHLAYYRPGLYLRHLVPTGTGLRAWLFAAIKLITPAFPIAADMEGQVQENLALLDSTIVGTAREMLASIVTKLLQSGAIDLKKWVAAVDLTADRAGFLLANDLELASEMIKAASEESAAVPQKERLRELAHYAISDDYFAIRRRLGISLDG